VIDLSPPDEIPGDAEQPGTRLAIGPKAIFMHERLRNHIIE